MDFASLVAIVVAIVQGALALLQIYETLLNWTRK